MKKLISIILVIVLLITLCVSKSDISKVVKAEKNKTESINVATKTDDVIREEDLDEIKDVIYQDLIDELDEDYFIENVEVSYYSQEYIDQLEYNSKENVFFGYTLSEVEDAFQGTPYVFTYDSDDNSTTVVEFEEYDDTYDRIIKNVAIGSGVIIVCVTVSAATSGAAPAMSLVFSVGAEKAAIGSLIGSGFGSLGTIVNQLLSEDGISEDNIKDVIKNTGLSASEGFKFGTIWGGIFGIVGEASAQHQVAKEFDVSNLNGLSKSEAIAIQRKTGWSPEVIKQLHSGKEIKIYEEANLVCEEINGSDALIREIDLDYVDDVVGKSNLELMKEGKAPIDPTTGKKYQLHHIGQKNDASLAILTEEEHQANTKILHYSTNKSEINKTAFNTQREKFWKSYAELAVA